MIYTDHEHLQHIFEHEVEMMSDVVGNYYCETKYHLGKANIVDDAWRTEKEVNPGRIQAIWTMSQDESGEKPLVV